MASDPGDSADDGAPIGDDDDGLADTCAAASDAALSADCRRRDDVAVADGGDDGNDDGDCDDDSKGDGGESSADDCTTAVGDEDANVAPVVSVIVETVAAEDGREPLPLLIRAPPPRGLLALLFLPKQVRGPVHEVEESEYDWEEDP